MIFRPGKEWWCKVLFFLLLLIIFRTTILSKYTSKSITHTCSGRKILRKVEWKWNLSMKTTCKMLNTHVHLALTNISNQRHLNSNDEWELFSENLNRTIDMGSRKGKQVIFVLTLIKKTYKYSIVKFTFTFICFSMSL